MEETGTTEEDIARVAVMERKNAIMTLCILPKSEITIEEALLSLCCLTNTLSDDSSMQWFPQPFFAQKIGLSPKKRR